MVAVDFVLCTMSSGRTNFCFCFLEDNPLNWSILWSGGKRTNQDSIGRGKQRPGGVYPLQRCVATGFGSTSCGGRVLYSKHWADLTAPGVPPLRPHSCLRGPPDRHNCRQVALFSVRSAGPVHTQRAQAVYKNMNTMAWVLFLSWVFFLIKIWPKLFKSLVFTALSNMALFFRNLGQWQQARVASLAF